MKIAIMQPYFFPYIGYFELISKVDYFIFLDDAQYTRRGWINRNKISKNNTEYKLVVPVKKSHQKTKIMDIEVYNNIWVDKHIKTFNHLYGKKIYKNNFIKNYQNYKNTNKLCDILINSIIETSNLFNLSCKFLKSSNLNVDKHGTEKIINICKKLNAKNYYNLPNGSSIYSNEEFKKNGINLIITNLTTKGFNSTLDFIWNENYNII